MEWVSVLQVYHLFYSPAGKQVDRSISSSQRRTQQGKGAGKTVSHPPCHFVPVWRVQPRDAQAHPCTHIDTHNTCIHICTHTHTNTQMHTCMHTQTHTHAHVLYVISDSMKLGKHYCHIMNIMEEAPSSTLL